MNNVNNLIEASKKPLLQDPSLIPIVECFEELVLLQDSHKIKVEPVWNTQDRFEGPLYRHYISKNPGYKGVYVRSSVVDKLKKAESDIPDRWILIVRAGHRPVAIQRALFTMVRDELRKVHSSLKEAELTELTREYVADPSQKASPHCVGSAIDIEAVDSVSGQLIDFGSPMNEDSEISNLHSSLVSKDQYENRLKLLSLMLKVGFAPLQSEWWHYSYGDQNWAAFYSEPNSIYDTREIEVTL
ncbi:MAG: zinc D-Ala-D-Ala dipeptidase [Patescibacteria group bacterium]|nr:zinc D-Ala-D-Ala dipeptidase [Patescibacteria group bacterium]